MPFTPERRSAPKIRRDHPHNRRRIRVSCLARPGKLRIIGGTWRGRALPVLAHPGLRPTPDRVRETLFNWLAPVIQGARVLDAFSGTGALGLEALSRGASEAVFVERNPQLARTIEAHLHTLGGNGKVMCGDFSAERVAADGFDVVFLDPPFHADLLVPAADTVAAALLPGHRVYMEYARDDAPALDTRWQILKQGQAGRVGYCLATFATAGEDTEL